MSIVSVLWRTIVAAFAAFIGFGLWTSFSAGNEPGAVGTVFLIAFLASPLIGWFWHRYASRKRQKAQARENEDRQLLESAREEQRRSLLRSRFLERQRLIDSVDKHRVALIRNLNRAVKENDYGIVTEDRTDEALDEFFASIDLQAGLLNFSEAKQVTLEQLEWRRVEDRAGGFDSDNLPFDGHEFEQWVAEALEGFGWVAKVTKGSGDQGIDVIAERSGLKVGLQCKLYGSAVGNKAVQEAHAGKAYHNLDVVGVLTNADFTQSAKDLGSVTGVALLSHHDIPSLYEKLAG